jgi:predicted nucleic acid-binding protein
VILVDTSVWIHHLRTSDARLRELLADVQVATHPMIIGELALGTMRRRTTILSLLRNLPSAAVATHDEVLSLVERRRLFGRGLSLIDAHLLASALLRPSTRLWSRDKQLSDVSRQLRVLWEPS